MPSHLLARTLLATVHRHEGYENQRRSHGTPLELSILRISPNSIRDKGRSIAAIFCHERCKRRYTNGCLHMRGSPFHCVECVEQSVRISKFLLRDAPWRVALPVQPPLVLRLQTVSGLLQPWSPHCRMVPAARRRLHVIPMQMGRRFSPKAMMLDWIKSCHNSGRETFR